MFGVGDLGGELEVLGNARLRLQEVGEHRTVKLDGVGVLDVEVHEGLARRVEGGDAGALDVLGVGGARRADLHGEGLALEVGEGLDLFSIGLADEIGEAGLVVGGGEVDLLLTFFGDGDARGDHVDRAGGERRDEGVKAHVHDLDVVAGLVGDGLDEVDVEAGELLGLRVEEFERRERGFGADAQRVAGHGVAGEGGDGKGGGGSGENFLEHHGKAVL